MPRTPKFTPYHDGTSWRISIPASVSKTRKQDRPRFPTKEAAEARAKELRAAHATHVKLVGELPSDLVRQAKYWHETFQFYGFNGLTDACEAFEKRLAAEHVSPTLASMAEGYLQDFTAPSTLKHIAWIRDTVMPDEWNRSVATMDLDFCRELLAAKAKYLKLAPKTSNDLKARLSGIWDHAMKNGRLPPGKNPWSIIASRKREVKQVHVVEPEQLRELLARCLKEDREMALYFAVLFFAGLRPDCEFQDFGSLRWEHVDWESGILHVHDTKNKDKTGRKFRFVPINPTLLSWLRAFKDYERTRVSKRRDEPGRICPASWDVRKDPLLVRPDGSVIVHWSGEDKTHRDISRHSYGSYLLASGATRHEVMEAMGHTNENTFRRHYENRRKPSQAAAYWALTYEALTQ